MFSISWPNITITLTLPLRPTDQPQFYLVQHLPQRYAYVFSFSLTVQGEGGGGGDSLPSSHIPRWSLAFRLSNLLSCSTHFLRDRFYGLRQYTLDSSIVFFPFLISLYDPLKWFFTHSSGEEGGGGGDSLPSSHICRWSQAFRLSNLLSCSPYFKGTV